MNKMKIAIGCDHAGYELKEILKSFLGGKGHLVSDKGTFSTDSVDYPDYAHAVCKSIELSETELGILICGSGNGINMAANKHAMIRAALCWKKEVAVLARQQNNANVLSLPARFINADEAKEITEAFFATEFEGGRHANRVNKISC
jgi:ribose 5-phosphate isomerase B